MQPFSIALALAQEHKKLAENHDANGDSENWLKELALATKIIHESNPQTPIDITDAANFSNEIGKCFYQKQHFITSEVLYKIAIATINKITNKDDTQLRIFADCCHSLVMSRQHSQLRLDTVFDLFNTAIQALSATKEKKRQDFYRLAVCYGGLSTLHRQQENYSEEESMLYQAINNLLLIDPKQLNDNICYYAGECYFNLGHLLQHQSGDSLNAIRNFQSALQILQKIKINTDEVERLRRDCLHLLALAYTSIGDNVNAAKAWLNAANKWHHIQHKIFQDNNFAVQCYDKYTNFRQKAGVSIAPIVAFFNQLENSAVLGVGPSLDEDAEFLPQHA